MKSICVVAFLFVSSLAWGKMVQIDCTVQDPCAHDRPLELNSCIFDRALLVQTKNSLHRASMRTFWDNKSKLYWGDVHYQDSSSLEFITDARYTDLRLNLTWKGGDFFTGELYFQEFPFAVNCDLSVVK